MSSQIDEIKSRVDIVELIGSYLKLQKAGANFKASCPFHNERTPSFNVSPARQIWHCFGCGKGGDILTFVQEIEGAEFPEALKMLAERAGVELRLEDPNLRSEKNRLFQLMEEAAKFFESNLAVKPQSNGLTALTYLKKRGLADDTISEFRLGYASEEWRALAQHLAAKGFKFPEMEKAGVAVKRGGAQAATGNSAEYFDRFRGRIMFPIFDYNGRVIAFGGRMFPERENEAKYVNSPETPLYQKSRTLYGLNKSKQEILKKGECVLVEGYMDMAMSWQGGVKNVVAVSGTALTDEQLKILRRLSEKLIAAFDMDEAGEGAARRGIALALGAGFDVRVAASYGFKDPAEVVAADPKIWEGAVEGAEHIVKFYMNFIFKKYSPETFEAKREVQKTLLPILATLSELELAHWIREVSAALNIKEEALWSAIAKAQPLVSKTDELTEKNSANNNPAPSRKVLLEGRILGIATMFPALAEKVDPMIGAILPKENRAAFFAELFLNTIVEAEAELVSCQKELKKEYIKDKLNKLSLEVASREKGSEKEAGDLLLEFKKLTEELSRL